MKNFFLTVFLLVTTVVAGQPGAFPAQVTVADLESTHYATDSSASAAVLYTRCQQQINYNGLSSKRVADFSLRIKIYNNEGLKYATRTLHYLKRGNRGEELTVKRAITYNLADGAMVTTLLMPESIFDEEVTKGLMAKKLMLPNVKPGSIIDVQYSITTPLFYHIPDWEFQQEIPVQQSELVTIVPNYFSFNTTFRGMQEIKEKHNYIHAEAGRTDKHTFYVAKNLPALKEAAFINTIENYSTSVQHELKVVSLPYSGTIFIGNTWDKVVQAIYNDEDFIGEMERDGYFKRDIDAVLKGVEEPEDRMNAVFAFVRDRMVWNKRCHVFCNKGVRTAYKEKSGNCAEINLMLIAMLRYAGIEAYPVLGCIRSHRIEVFPSYGAFNYVTCSARINAKNILLDATSPWNTPNVLPLRALNWKGFMLRNRADYEEIELIPTTVSHQSTVVSAEIDTQGQCKGRLRNSYTNHMASVFRENYSENAGNETYLTAMEKVYNNIHIDNYKVNALKETEKPVVEEFDFTTANGAELIGGKIYLSPMLFFSEDKNPFNEKDRKYPIDFGYPVQRRYIVNIAVPQGYAVESLPQPVAYRIGEDLGSFKFSLQEQANAVQLTVIISYDKGVVDAGHYNSFHDVYEKVIEKFREKIVLKKA